MKQVPTTAAKAAKKSATRMTVLLAVVVAAAIAVALATARTSHGADIGADARPPPSSSPAVAVADQVPAAEEGAVSGEVLEAVPVSKYTYLRLQTAGGEIWAAVPSATVAIGSHVAISNATPMLDFKSATLGKSFKLIYFGTLGAPVPAVTDDGLQPKFPLADEQEFDGDQPLPPGHPVIGVGPESGALSDDSNPLPSGHPEIGRAVAANASPHGGVSDSAGPLPMPKITRASGKSGRLIGELLADRFKLAGQSVRVRGQVTKVTPDIQGRAFFHLRDGSAEGKGSAADLAVTSLIAPTVGQVATFEGTLRADDDIGIGYKYPALLEDATVVGESK